MGIKTIGLSGGCYFVKVLIISTFYSAGGAEIQVKSEKKSLEKRGIKTFLLTCDPQYKTNESLERNHLNIYGKYSKIERWFCNIFINIKLLFNIKGFIGKFKPDIIHFHNIFFAFNTICLATKKYNTIQTIHDYSIICPKGEMVLPDHRICTSCNYRNCISICYQDGMYKRIKIVYLMFIRWIQQYYRNKYISILIAPSRRLMTECRKYGYQVSLINNGIDVEAFCYFNKKLDSNKKIILYYGVIKENKGILKLLEYYSSNDYETIELHIAGKIDNSVDENEFRKMVLTKGAVYCGYLSYEEIIKKLENVYSIIIPSIWMENYPNTALEGLISECVVCGSNRGGISEIVLETELLFDILDKDQVKDCLKYIDQMTETERKRICERQKEQFYKKNTDEIYIQNLIELLKFKQMI